MSNGMNRLIKGLIGVLVAVVVLVVGSTFVVRYIERTQWIARTVDTQAMSDARQLNPNKRLDSKSILQQATRTQKTRLYNAMLYPQVRTVVCTFDRPEQFEEFAVYLVSDTGITFPGWYNPESMGEIASERNGIVKAMFENLTTNQLTELHIVDKAQVTIPYKPTADIPKIVFSLTAPSNSEIEAMSASSTKPDASSEAK